MQYFGDAPERGYVFEKNVVPFTGEDQYQDLVQCKKPPASRIAHKKVRHLRPLLSNTVQVWDGVNADVFNWCCKPAD